MHDAKRVFHRHTPSAKKQNPLPFEVAARFAAIRFAGGFAFFRMLIEKTIYLVENADLIS